MRAEVVLLMIGGLLVLLAVTAAIVWSRAERAGEGSAAPIGTWSAADPDLGRRAYAMCLGCHGVDGRGVPGYAPPLVGASWLLGDARAAALIVLHGYDATGEPGAPYFSSRMAGHGQQLADHEIAALLSWARQQWGNRAPPIEAALVRELRQRYAGRERPWSPAELRAVLAAP